MFWVMINISNYCILIQSKELVCVNHTCMRERAREREREVICYIVLRVLKSTAKLLDYCFQKILCYYPLMHQEVQTCHNQKDPLQPEAPQAGHNQIDPEGLIWCHFFDWKQSHTDPSMSRKHHPPIEFKPPSCLRHLLCFCLAVD